MHRKFLDESRARNEDIHGRPPRDQGGDRRLCPERAAAETGQHNGLHEGLLPEPVPVPDGTHAVLRERQGQEGRGGRPSLPVTFTLPLQMPCNTHRTE